MGKNTKTLLRPIFGNMSLISFLFLTACGSLPVAGPSTSKILSQGKKENQSPTGKFTLIPVDENVLGVLNASSALHVFQSGKSPASPSDSSTQKICIGDVISVTIYTTGGGLFSGGTTLSSSGANSATKEGGVSIGTSVPQQVVDQTESITVPYVGRIKVAGKFPSEVEAEIAERMKGMAFNPYAIVTMNQRLGSDLVSVTGDVKIPKRISVPLPGLRVADAISESGGSTGKDFETDYTVTRGGHAITGNLATALRDPSLDIFLKPGDILSVRACPWNFMTLGATGQSLRPFLVERLTLAEAIASSGGLDDQRSNPGGVFVYRLESPEVLHRLSLRTVRNTSELQPVIYHVNLRQPRGFFKAKQFVMQDKDLIYVGDAGSLGFQKAMMTIGALTAPVMTGASAAGGAVSLSTVH